MMMYIFLYNLESIKSDFSKLCYSQNQKMVLIASEYCLTHLSPEKRACFDAICELPKMDSHEINYEEVEKIVASYFTQYGPKNIRLLTNEDSTQLICAKLREKYGITGFDVDQIQPFVNKQVAKRRIADVVRVPKSVSFDCEQYADNKEAYLNLIVEKIAFPMLINPVGFVDSVEEYHVPNLNKLKDIAEKISKYDYGFEIDEYIDGDIFHCDILLINKKIKFFVIGKYSTSPARFFQSTPLGILQVEDQDTIDIFKRPCEKILEKLDAPSGAYHIEAFLPKNAKEFVFLGVAARNGGHFIIKMCDRKYGINIEEINYSIQMGLIDDLQFTTKKVFLGSIAFPKMVGQVIGVTKPAVDIRSEFIEYVKAGDVFTDVQNLSDMSSGIVFWDDSYQKVVDIFERLKKYNPLEMLSTLPILKQPEKILDILFDTIPFMFWKDINGRYQGANLNQIKNAGIAGVNSVQDIVGKTIYGVIDDHEMARLIDENDNRVMKENVTLLFEERIGEKTYYSQKSPICDDQGGVIGLLGFSMDITEFKQKEEELVKKVSNTFQAVHDIRSPLASLSMIVESCRGIPEAERIALKNAATSIGDIANNLLNAYRKGRCIAGTGAKESQKVLLSLALLELLSKKKYQYKNLTVKFNCSFASDSNFIFIQTNLSDFNRMVSNLINNAVDAFEGKKGIVDLKINLDRNYVNVIIQDNGKGMPREVVNKIMNNIVVTNGKKNGHGIGLAQVRETLQAINGKMVIESKVGKGTQVTLTFPRVEAPDWMAEHIELRKNNTIVILDDDSSIHGAWKARFKTHKSKIKLHHFKSGADTIDFINNSTAKDKILLLSDFELINQELNGLQIIKQLAMQKHAILVTNHHNDQSICDLASEERIKILPKQLASNIPVHIL